MMKSDTQIACQCGPIPEKRRIIARRLSEHSHKVQTGAQSQPERWLAQQYQQAAEFFNTPCSDQAGASVGGA